MISVTCQFYHLGDWPWPFLEGIILITLMEVRQSTHCGYDLAGILGCINGEREQNSSMHSLLSAFDSAGDVTSCLKLLLR